MRAAVVGGGFWGLVSALALARSGLRVVVFEEHGRVGVPEHCTGLVSRRVLEALGGPVERSVVSWYPRFRLCGPTSCVTLEPEGGVYKLDRVGVEERLMEEAESEGVEFRLGVRVSRVEPGGSLAWPGGSASFDVVVLAEGAPGRLRRGLGAGYSGGYIYGVNTVVEDCNGGGRGYFTVAFHREARGLFSWLVPLPGGGCVLGTGARDPRLIPRALGAAARILGAPGGLRASRSYGGPLPLDGPAGRLRVGRVVVVGDAAGLVKPLTGGGLYPAAEFYRAALAGLDGGDPALALERAASRVASTLSRQVGPARILRGNPGVVDCIARAAGESGLAGALKGRVDYDLHHRIPFKALRAAPARSLAAGLRALARCPAAVAKLSLTLLAGLLGAG